MKTFLKRLTISLIAPIIGFYILPMLIRDTGSGMFVLIGAIPILCFINAIWVGLKETKWYIYCLCIYLLFLPTVYIFYNSSAMFYTYVFTAISVVGCLFGWGTRYLRTSGNKKD